MLFAEEQPCRIAPFQLHGITFFELNTITSLQLNVITSFQLNGITSFQLPGPMIVTWKITVLEPTDHRQAMPMLGCPPTDK
jgi:hypothetical protein